MTNSYFDANTDAGFGSSFGSNCHTNSDFDSNSKTNVDFGFYWHPGGFFGSNSDSKSNVDFRFDSSLDLDNSSCGLGS